GPVRRQEAKAIATLVRRIRAEEWPVLDREATEREGEERFRAAQYGDMCILMPQRTGLRLVELALDDSGIPYRLEGASLVFVSQEVRDLLACLRAIDDPADQVSLVGALRSPALACSDADLLAFVESGGRLDYLAQGNPVDGPVAEALACLKVYHERRLWVSPTALIEAFTRERRLMEAALGYARPRERWRRYAFLIERARAFAQAGESSLRAFLEWAERQADEGARVTEVPVPESDEDAVRVMTVHGAKGLEFPIVVLTGLNAEPSGRARSVLFDREARRVEVRLGPKDNCFQTAGYEALAEREAAQEAAENVRLMYVAATRARDHLVVSLYRTSGDDGSRAAALAGLLEGAHNLWEAAPEGDALLSQGTAQEPDVSVAGDTPEAGLAWLEARERLLGERGRPAAVAATSLARVAKEEAGVPEEPWRRGRGRTSLGRAVHAVLQTVDLATGDGLEATARAQATAEGVPQWEKDVIALARVALEANVVRRALASKGMWREVPVACPVGDGVLEGFIDLLFDEGDGLVVVDFKTDVLESEAEVAEAMERYRLQGGAYALALQHATGRPVKEVAFLFLQPKQEVALRDVSTMAHAASELATAHLRPPSHAM
ncbi:MAG: 3'-5' exonuclease, partial [Chloroflexota bacterium]|nr:3'-5' exonuclease [Chloroflexota bacterium]